MLRLIAALEAAAIVILLISDIRLEWQFDRVYRAAAGAANIAAGIEDHFDASGEVGCR